MIVVNDGAVGRSFVEVTAGSRVSLRVDVPNRGAVRWSLLASPPGSVQTFESATDRSTGLQTVAADIANMYVVRLDVDAGKETASFDVVVLGMPDARGWVIPAFPIAGPDGQVEPAFADVGQTGLVPQPTTDPWNVTWGMRRILNSIRTLLGSVGTLIRVDDVDIGSRPAVNFLSGDGVQLEGVDDASTDEVEVRISADSSVLFQWDGQTTDQFGPPLKPSALLFEYVFPGTPEVTVVARTEGNRLRIKAPGTGPSNRGLIYVPIAASLGVSLPMRYIMEYSLIDATVHAALYGGVAYYCNGEVATAEDVRAVVQASVCFGGFQYHGVISETTWYQSVGAEYQFNSQSFTPGGGPIPVFVRIEVTGQKPVGDQPGFVFNVESHGHNGDGSACGRSDDSNYFPQPWPDGWDDLTAADIDQAGLILFANGAIDDPFVEFGHFRILRHPADM